MNKEKQKTQSSQLSKRLLVQYFSALLVFAAALILLVFLAKVYCDSRIWYGYEPLYGGLQVIKDNLQIFVLLAVLGGWSLITYFFISRSLHYLNEVLEVSGQLAAPSSEPIVLSPAMADVQGKLNLVREKALSDAKAVKDSEQRKNDLVMYLAHDLKTPLTSVIGYLTLLNDEPQISEELRKKYLNIALDKAERLEDLTNEFFEITRFNLSHISLECGTVDLTLMLEQTIFEFQPILAEKELQCRLFAEPNTMLVCDPDKLQRVFDNLLRNAANYSYPASDIEIAVIKKATDAEIHFVNQGRTIPKERLSRVFDQFFRLDSSRGTKNGGSGLGLAIAKEIVELHGGTITAQSEEERIEFTVVLPLS